MIRIACSRTQQSLYRVMKNLILPLLAAILVLGFAPRSSAFSAEELQTRSEKALDRLLHKNKKAHAISEQAIAVLVFPEVIKGGFMIAAQRGDGVLFKNGQVAGYYNTTAASYGIQAGIQKYSYALFFMNEESLDYLAKSGGFEVGTAPSLVVVDEGISSSLSTTTLQKGIYAFLFGQKGLMGGLGLQGTKITEFTPSE
jgi:lipid-binding SYLF domain-containing protein